MYNVTYLELDPQYDCSFTDGNFGTCTKEDICKGNKVIDWAVDYESEFTLENWIIALDLYCTPSAYIGLLGALAFAGAAIGCLFLPIASDKFGRWPVLQWTAALQIPLYLLALLTRNLAVIYFLCFYVGVALIGKFAAGFVLLTEILPSRYVAYGQTAFCCGDTAANLYLTFYYRFISRNSYPTLWFTLILNLVTVVLFCFVPESPAWLASQKRFAEAK